MKQETLEEFAENYANQITENDEFYKLYEAFIAGAKWKQERSYSEEDLREAYMVGKHGGTTQTYYEFKEWFEQFKKKYC